MTKPVIKWIGGKTQIIDTIISNVPLFINNYYEPFVGGGSVLFALLENKNIKINKIYASDVNEKLILLYKQIQLHPNELIDCLKKIVTTFCSLDEKKYEKREKINPVTLEDGMNSKQAYYYWIRNEYNNLTLNGIDKKYVVYIAAMFIFLNKTCFRGLYREGKNGFNVPYGNYKNPSIYDENHILQVSSLIKDVIFTHTSFETALSDVNENDFVYLDPPYVKELKTSFDSYVNNGFNLHDTLFNLCKILHGKKIKITMSNSNVQSTIDYFTILGFTVTSILCCRRINSKQPQSKVLEIIIKNH
jgi:DNA adenine methylase